MKLGSQFFARIASNSAILAAGRAIGLLPTVWLGRNLSLEDFGILGSVLMIHAAMQRLATFGLDPIVLRRASGAPLEERQRLYATFLRSRGRGIGLLTVAWLAGCAVLHLIGWDRASVMALLTTPLIFNRALDLFPVCQAEDKLTTYAWFSLRSPILLLLAVGLIVKPGTSGEVAAAAHGAAALLSLPLEWAFLRRFVPRLRLIAAAPSFALREGRWVLLGMMAAFGYTLIEVPLVAALYGPDQAGLYRAAALWGMACTLLVAVTNQLLLPRLISAAREGGDFFAETRSWRAVILAGALVGAVLAGLLARPVMNLIFGPKFDAAAPLVGPLVASKLIVLWVSCFSGALIARKREREVALVALAVSVVALGTNYLASGFTSGPIAVPFISLGAELTVGLVLWRRLALTSSPAA